jgi:polyhydroxyalkanoate synthesis regulator phasin
MTDELIAKGKQLVEELGEEPKLSSRWMAHYVAELMERAESEDGESRQQAAHLCAELIIKLWGVRLQKHIVEVERDLRAWFKRGTFQYNPEERYERLKTALNDLEGVTSDVNADMALDWGTLRDVEDDLLQLWLVAEAAGKPDEKQFDEIARKFDKSDAEVYGIQNRLNKVFPAMAEVSLGDLTKVRKCVIDCLRKVTELQHAVLWQPSQASGETSSEETVT